MLKWANKKQNNFDIYNIVFKKNLNDMSYSPWDIEQNILKLLILGHFLLFYLTPRHPPTPKNHKNQNFENKNIWWRYHHFTHVYQKSMTIIWYTVSEKRSETHKIFVILGYFLPFQSLGNLENQKFGVLLPFYSLTTPIPLKILKIKILKKNEKTPGGFFLLYMHVYHKWRSYHNNFWNVRCDRQKCLSFWTIFFPFSLLKTWKIKIFTLKKTHGDIIILYTCTINDNDDVWFLRYGAHQTIFCHSGPFFALLPLYGSRKLKFRKNEINNWIYYHFTNVHQKSWSYAILFMRYSIWWM